MTITSIIISRGAMAANENIPQGVGADHVIFWPYQKEFCSPFDFSVFDQYSADKMIIGLPTQGFIHDQWSDGPIFAYRPGLGFNIYIPEGYPCKVEINLAELQAATPMGIIPQMSAVQLMETLVTATKQLFPKTQEPTVITYDSLNTSTAACFVILRQAFPGRPIVFNLPHADLLTGPMRRLLQNLDISYDHNETEISSKEALVLKALVNRVGPETLAPAMTMVPATF